MKKLLLILILSAVTACSSSNAENTKIDPIVGHWTFTQLTVNHPASLNYASAPSLCIGDADFREDGTFAAWNVCKNADSADRTAAPFAGTWVRISTYHYRVNNGDYDFVLSKDGNSAVFGSTTTTNPHLVGQYEYGQMMKDVVIDHAELQ